MIGKIISLSLIEKFLLKNGWLVKDSFDPASRTLLTRARREIPPDELIYPKPTYYYHRRPAEEVLGHVLEDLGRLETLDHSSLVLKINQSLETPPPGFDCRLCGQCCRRMRDAFQGLVTREEVRYWRAMGQEKILRLVRERTTPEYTVYEAWVNPKTGEFFKRCPWLARSEGSNRFHCLIHEYKPIKCRVFPFSREQAEYSGCRAFEDRE